MPHGNRIHSGFRIGLQIAFGLLTHGFRLERRAFTPTRERRRGEQSVQRGSERLAIRFGSAQLAGAFAEEVAGTALPRLKPVNASRAWFTTYGANSASAP
jgi:hypothetical protein